MPEKRLKSENPPSKTAQINYAYLGHKTDRSLFTLEKELFYSVLKASNPDL